MLERAVLILSLLLTLLVLDPLAAQAETNEDKPPSFKQKHPIIYWVVAGPTYPFRHPKKTLDGICYPVVHPCKFGMLYEGSGVSGTANFFIQAGTAAGIYLMRR